MFKRIIASTMLISLLVTVIPSMDQASAAGTGYHINVSSGYLNVRNQPSLSGKVYTKLPKGYNVTVTSQDNGWSRISYSGKIGYVSSKYIAPGSTVTKSSTVSTDYQVKAISIAKSQMGVRYVLGGTTPSGFDCSGLVTYAFKNAGYNKLPRTAADMYNIGTKVTSYQPGDLLFYATSGGKKVTHVAIYIGNSQVIHAATSKGVSIANIHNSYWQPKFIGAKRL
ncbi:MULTISPECIES: C40 family peptidase [Mesobacillus]|uniref:Cell wall-associated NlpC family hydrolase n=1 Tax=Mesobacillus stamsii TaxID=225347 RepID=A0ABU0FQI1_9BACI|nr:MULTISPECIES: SH3 domain-containing C40 family peptidase [Mesobacillus]MDQ0412162.1 cell wall-associated NlpC family hydrolase [Mesobacillus stamsii]